MLIYLFIYFFIFLFIYVLFLFSSLVFNLLNHDVFFCPPYIFPFFNFLTF